MKAPCKNCTDRVVGCHSTCEKYKDWKKKDKERKQKIFESKMKSRYYRSTATTKVHQKKRKQTSHNKEVPYMRDK